MSNLNKLIIRIMSRDAVPKDGGPADAFRFLADKDLLTNGAKKAKTEALAMIKAVRCAKEPNLFKMLSDEEIAGMIVETIENHKSLSNTTTKGAHHGSTRE